MFFGFVVPFLLGVFLYSRIMVGEHVDDAAIKRAVSINLKVTMIGLPIGITGAACWLIGVVRQANRYIRSSDRIG